MGKEGWDGINTRKEDKIPAKLDKLERLIAKEKGVKVNRADVLRIIVDEALDRRVK